MEDEGLAGGRNAREVSSMRSGAAHAHGGSIFARNDLLYFDMEVGKRSEKPFQIGAHAVMSEYGRGRGFGMPLVRLVDSAEIIFHIAGVEGGDLLFR